MLWRAALRPASLSDQHCFCCIRRARPATRSCSRVRNTSGVGIDPLPASERAPDPLSRIRRNKLSDIVKLYRMRRLLVGLLLLMAPTSGFWFAAQMPTHIVIVHTNDLHGQLLPRDGVGGIAEIATVIRAARPDLILDAGDISTG